MRSRFSKPIPGQSWTTTPGNSPWEKPPQFTNVDKAMDFLIDRLLNDTQITKICMLLKKKVPVELLVQTLLFTGFAEGKWTFDLMVLLAKPLTGLILTLYSKANGGKMPPTKLINNSGVDPGLASLMSGQSALEGLDTTPKPEEAAPEKMRSGGLMGI